MMNPNLDMGMGMNQHPGMGVAMNMESNMAMHQHTEMAMVDANMGKGGGGALRRKPTRRPTTRRVMMYDDEEGDDGFVTGDYDEFEMANVRVKVCSYGYFVPKKRNVDATRLSCSCTTRMTCVG